MNQTDFYISIIDEKGFSLGELIRQSTPDNAILCQPPRERNLGVYCARQSFARWELDDEPHQAFGYNMPAKLSLVGYRGVAEDEYERRVAILRHIFLGEPTTFADVDDFVRKLRVNNRPVVIPFDDPNNRFFNLLRRRGLGRSVATGGSWVIWLIDDDPAPEETSGNN